MENFEKPHYSPDEESSKMETSEDQMEENIIPNSEISEHFSRSSGKGGQNVNKVSTKVEARWNINESEAFSEEEKKKIKAKYPNRINDKGELIVTSEETREQSKNREDAIKKLNDLVGQALKEERERIPTKPTKSSKEKRIEKKKHRGETKKMRSKDLRDYE